jgi:hypothetical protein
VIEVSRNGGGAQHWPLRPLLRKRSDFAPNNNLRRDIHTWTLTICGNDFWKLQQGAK